MPATDPESDWIYADPRVGEVCPWKHRTAQHPDTCDCLGAGRVGVRVRCPGCTGCNPVLSNGDRCRGTGTIDREPELLISHDEDIWMVLSIDDKGCMTVQAVESIRDAAAFGGRCAWWGVEVKKWDGQWRWRSLRKKPSPWFALTYDERGKLIETPDAALLGAIDAKGGRDAD